MKIIIRIFTEIHLLIQCHPRPERPPEIPLFVINISKFSDYCFQRAWPIETRGIPSSKAHLYFPVLTSFQKKSVEVQIPA
jgi:hypothetical protein